MLGGAGFLGGRLAERLVAECGARVRLLMRRISTATPAVRYPVEVVIGDVADRGALEVATRGMDVVFNCAKGSGADPAHRRAVDVDAAGRVVEAAAKPGARVVHVSTFVVYDLPEEGDLDEHAAAAPAGDSYADNKRAGEHRVLETAARTGVPAVVLQPTVVYGPRATVHGSEILDEMRVGRLVLVNGGTGICNAVYVDDVVTAMLLAATSERAVGRRVLVSGAEHPTWAAFFGAFERMLGRSATVAMSAADALALWERSHRRPWLVTEGLRLVRGDKDVRRRLLATREGAMARAMVELVAPRVLRSAESWSRGQGAAPAPDADGVSPSRPWVVRYLAKRARVRIDSARALLGYEPAFDLKAGLGLTEAWARWAGLLG